MKRKTLNKILILTLTLSLTLSAVASAKPINSKSRVTRNCVTYIDPFPYEGSRK